MYKVLRSVLFCFDPEWVHYFSMNGLRLLCRIGFIKKLITASFKPKKNIPYSLFNIQFPNRVGLGAGFDKNAKYLNELEALGFGFVEIGTVTPVAQYGNDKPRLFRLPKDKALINRMGFNNDGVEVVAERLKRWQMAVGKRQKSFEKKQGEDGELQTVNCKLIIGGNIGKNKLTPNEDAWRDYEKCFLALHNFVDYFVVNVSSPNTPGLRALQEKDSLHKILTNLQMQNLKFKSQKPILLKIAPDLSIQQIDDVIALAVEIKLDGLVASNTTIHRDQLITPQLKLTKIGAGGLSGLPLKNRSTEIVQYIHQKTNGRPYTPAGKVEDDLVVRAHIPVIASGGIFTGAHAKEKIDAGASLVQVWTGFIYEGPAIVKRICNYLQK